LIRVKRGEACIAASEALGRRKHPTVRSRGQETGEARRRGVVRKKRLLEAGPGVERSLEERVGKSRKKERTFALAVAHVDSKRTGAEGGGGHNLCEALRSQDFHGGCRGINMWAAGGCRRMYFYKKSEEMKRSSRWPGWGWR